MYIFNVPAITGELNMNNITVVYTFKQKLASDSLLNFSRSL